MFNKKLVKIYFFFSIAASVASLLNAAEQIGQDNATPIFGQNITAKAFDRATGTLYLATDVANDAFTIAKAGPADTVFTGLATGTIGADNAPAACIIAANAGNANLQLPSPLMSFLKYANKNLLVAITGGGGNNTVGAFNADSGVFVDRSGALKSAANAAIAVAAVDSKLKLCTGIATVGGNKVGKAFVYVYPAAGPGAAGSGICSAKIDFSANTVVADTYGGNVGQAQLLDITKMGFVGLGNDGLLGKDAAAGNAGLLSIVNNGCFVNDLYWDDELQVLYIGLSVRSAQANGNSTVAYALVKATLDLNTGLFNAFDVRSRVTGDHAAFGNGYPAAKDMDNNGGIDGVFAMQGNNNKFSTLATVKKIRGMRTSTGKKYLILNAKANNRAVNDGGALLFDSQHNIATIYAVRVATATVGDLQKGDVIQNFQNAETMLGNDWNPEGYAPGALGKTIVGTTALKFDAVNDQFITDMEVVGDAVYASVGRRAGVAGVRNATNDIGVFCSRAIFDYQGIIVRWTPWERVWTSETPPVQFDAVHFFAVDANRGTLWKVCKDATGGPTQNTPRVVKRTSWSVPQPNATSESLSSRLNADFADSGCTAVLDLPTGTPGLGAVGNISNSFALFGGNGRVIFAQTKSANANAVEVAFQTNAANAYKITVLPGDAGYVRSLGFARAFENSKGYFFAGADGGLYVWAATAGDHAGYNSAAGLTNLGAAPFLGAHVWMRMADTGNNAITGPVTAIEANGTAIFVVEQDVTSKGIIVSKLHRFALANDVTGMTNAVNHAIIAQSGVGGIPKDAIFTSFALVSVDGHRADQSWGLLATNVGLFGSHQHLVTAPWPVQSNVSWDSIDQTSSHLLLKSSKRIPNVVPLLHIDDEDGYAQGAFTVSLVDDNRQLNYLQNSKVQTIGIDWGSQWGDTVLHSYVNSGAGLTFLDRTTSFWTDGARRFFTTYNPATQTGSILKSMPFATTEWNMNGPVPINKLAGINRVNWIENISGLGILMIGTDKGVATLE
jgi:hypothetical protein